MSDTRLFLIDLVKQALAQFAPELTSSDLGRIEINRNKHRDHGDFSTNVALAFSKSLGIKPQALAATIKQSIVSHPSVKKIEIGGPGFINFYLYEAARANIILDILRQDHEYGRSNLGQGKKIIIEFVSSNPTGPLHVGHGRTAAYGATLANILAFTQHQVHREYYVNDAGRQMDILTVSVWLRYLSHCEQTVPFPENAYQGVYISDIAQEIYEAHHDEYLVLSHELLKKLPSDVSKGGDKEIYMDALIERSKKLLGEANYRAIHAISLNMILSNIKEDLAAFRVNFDEWFSECTLFADAVVEKTLSRLKGRSLTYEKADAVWFKSASLGDDKDRVLIRSNGQPTYFAPDIAYHVNKFDRGFDRVIDVFGADHHGYAPRIRAALGALDYDINCFEVPIIQFARLCRGREQVQMSTRSGQYVTLKELIDEVGCDAARYFYVQRKHEQHIDFDLSLAKSKNHNNPVFYIQYAHARICRLFEQLVENDLYFDEHAIHETQLEQLGSPYETALLVRLSRFPEIVRNAALHKEPHHIAYYLYELACDFHGYYHKVKFLVLEDKIRNARLALAVATRVVLRNGLGLLDISAPEQM